MQGCERRQAAELQQLAMVAVQEARQLQGAQLCEAQQRPGRVDTHCCQVLQAGRQLVLLCYALWQPLVHGQAGEGCEVTDPDSGQAMRVVVRPRRATLHHRDLPQGYWQRLLLLLGLG